MSKPSLWTSVSDELQSCCGSEAQDQILAVVELLPHEALGLSRKPSRKLAALIVSHRNAECAKCLCTRSPVYLPNLRSNKERALCIFCLSLSLCLPNPLSLLIFSLFLFVFLSASLCVSMFLSLSLSFSLFSPSVCLSLSTLYYCARCALYGTAKVQSYPYLPARTIENCLPSI